jgi:hypothetical protein
MREFAGIMGWANRRVGAHTLALSPLGLRGLETSIWPFRILFRGYGTKMGAFRQGLGAGVLPTTLKN